MIISEGGVGNAWFRVAIMWFVGNIFLMCLVFCIFYNYRFNLLIINYLAIVMLAGSFIFWFIGKFICSPNRILTFVTILGLFGFIPLLCALLIPLLSLIFLTFGASLGALCFGAACLIVSAYWMRREVNGLKARIIKRKFIEIEFKIKPKYIVIKRSPHVRLDPSQIKTGSMAEKIWDWLLPKLIFLIFMGYPLQKLFYNIGGTPAVMALLSCFSVPLAIHMLGELACGFYLWIYIVWKLEKQHGKPVIFV